MVKFWFWVKQIGWTVKFISYQENVYRLWVLQTRSFSVKAWIGLTSEDWGCWERNSGQGKFVTHDDSYDQGHAGAGQSYSVELVGKNQCWYMNHRKTYTLDDPLFTGLLMLWEALSAVLGLVCSSLFPSRYTPCLDFLQKIQKRSQVICFVQSHWCQHNPAALIFLLPLSLFSLTGS